MASTYLPPICKKSQYENYHKIDNLKGKLNLDRNCKDQGRLLLDGVRCKMVVGSKFLDKSRLTNILRSSNIQQEQTMDVADNTSYAKYISINMKVYSSKLQENEKTSQNLKEVRIYCDLEIFHNVSFALLRKRSFTKTIFFGDSFNLGSSSDLNDKPARIDKATVNYLIDKSIFKSSQGIRNQSINANQAFSRIFNHRSLLRNRKLDKPFHSLNFDVNTQYMEPQSESQFFSNPQRQILMNLTYIPLSMIEKMKQHEDSWDRLEYSINTKFKLGQEIICELESSLKCGFPMKYCLISNFYHSQGISGYFYEFVTDSLNQKFYLSEISKWKKSYINLVRRWHPDKLLGHIKTLGAHQCLLNELQELSGSVIEASNACYKQINEALIGVVN